MLRFHSNLLAYGIRAAMYAGKFFPKADIYFATYRQD
jgi:hypothetical protein